MSIYDYRLQIPSQADIENKIKEYLRDGVLEITEEINYNGIGEYKLSSTTNIGSSSVIEIIEITGYNDDGKIVSTLDLINNDTLVLNTDYRLYPITGGGSVPDNPYNQSAYTGKTLYNGIEFLTDKFKKPSIVKIKYKYFDINKISKITNFNTGTVAKAIVDSMALLISELYREVKQLYENTFIDTVEGKYLDNFASFFSITRGTGKKSSGYVYVENIGTEDFTISQTNRFVVPSLTPIVFQKVSPTDIVIGTGESAYILIESVDVGKDKNVGVGTITTIYENDSLSTELSGYKCYNPPYDENGNPNYFINGEDDETDEELKARVINFVKSKYKGRTESIVSALKNIEYINNAKIFDYEDIKSLTTGEIIAVVIREGSKLISEGELNEILTLLDTLIPLGIKKRVIRPTLMYVDLDTTIQIKYDYWTQRDDIKNIITTKLTNLINNLDIGEDLNEGKIIATILEDNRIKDTEVNDITITTYSFDPYETDNNGYLLYDYNGGTPISKYFAQSFYLPSQRYKKYFTFTTGQTEINCETGHEGRVVSRNNEKPSIYLVLQDSYGKYYRHPTYIIDFINPTTPIDNTYTKGQIVSDTEIYDLQNNDLLCFDYYYVKYDKIHGMRIPFYILSIPSNDLTFEIKIYEDDNFTTLITSKNVTIITSSLETGINYMDFEFDTEINLLNSLSPNRKFWITIHLQSSDVNVYLVTSKINDPEFTLNAIDIKDSSDETTWTALTNNKNIPLKMFIKRSTNSSYFLNDKSIEVMKNFYKPEILLLNNLTITEEVYKDV